MVSVPPCGMASRALVARFMRTWSIWVTSSRLKVSSSARFMRKPDVLGKKPRQELCRARDDPVHRVGLQGDPLLAAEGEEALGEVGRPLGRGHDLVYVRPETSSLSDAHLDKVGKPHDDGEDVVEVVGDAAGQGAHGLHLLGLAELLFEPFFSVISRMITCENCCSFNT